MTLTAKLGQFAIFLCCVIAIQSAKAQTIDYQEFEQLFGEPVTVSATGKPERVSDTPVTMDIITAGEIKRSGARDLASLLRMIPGVITYRGYNGIESFTMGALLLNGREIYLASFEQNFLESIPVALEEIRQIEMVRGPQSALYGFNSSEGVINIITFDPSQDPLNLVQLRGGNDARRAATMLFSAELAPGIGMRLTASADHAHDQGEENSVINPDNPDRRFLAATFAASLPNGDHASLEISHSDLAGRSVLAQSSLFYDARLQTDAVKADYSAETSAGRIGALFSYTALTIPESVIQSQGALRLHDHNVYGKLEDLIKIGPADSLRLGFETRDEAYHNNSSLASIDSLLFAPSVMWEHRFSPDLSLINAVRYTHVTSTQAPSPGDNNDYAHPNHGLADNSALIDRLDHDNSLRLSFGRGVLLQSPLGLQQAGLVGDGAAKSSLAQQPSIATIYVSETRISWDHHFDDQATLFRLSLFNEKSTNLVSLFPIQILASLAPVCATASGAIARYCHTLETTSGLSGTVDGAEAEIAHRDGAGLQWALNYSLQTLHPHGTDETGLLLPALGENQIFHRVNASAGYGWSDWSLDLRLNYASAFRGLVLAGPPVNNIMLDSDKPSLTLAPHVSWAAGNGLSIDLAADNLWQTEATYLTRLPITYFLTVNWSY